MTESGTGGKLRARAFRHRAQIAFDTVSLGMGLYAKVNRQTKRQAVGCYQGALVPAHFVEYPEKDTVPVRHKSDTGTEG